jgi:uncharacterized membrane protein
LDVLPALAAHHDRHHANGAALDLNFVQTRTVPKIEPAEHRAAITKYIQPNVMFWFRYAALATVVFGLLLALKNGYLLQALTFQWGIVAIGIGM